MSMTTQILLSQMEHAFERKVALAAVFLFFRSFCFLIVGPEKTHTVH